MLPAVLSQLSPLVLSSLAIVLVSSLFLFLVPSLRKLVGAALSPSGVGAPSVAGSDGTVVLLVGPQQSAKTPLFYTILRLNSSKGVRFSSNLDKAALFVGVGVGAAGAEAGGSNSDGTSAEGSAKPQGDNVPSQHSPAASAVPVWNVKTYSSTRANEATSLRWMSLPPDGLHADTAPPAGRQSRFMLVDIPGHSRLRNTVLADYLPIATHVVLCVGSSAAQIRELADMTRTDNEDSSGGNGRIGDDGLVPSNENPLSWLLQEQLTDARSNARKKQIIVCCTDPAPSVATLTGSSSAVEENLRAALQHEWKLANVSDQFIQHALAHWKFIHLAPAHGAAADSDITPLHLASLETAIRGGGSGGRRW